MIDWISINLYNLFNLMRRVLKEHATRSRISGLCPIRLFRCSFLNPMEKTKIKYFNFVFTVDWFLSRDFFSHIFTWNFKKKKTVKTTQKVTGKSHSVRIDLGFHKSHPRFFFESIQVDNHTIASGWECKVRNKI